MKKIITLAILVLSSITIQIIDVLPWWSYLFPIFLLGIFLPLQRWKVSPFILGFAAGNLVWLLPTLYFELIYNGKIINTISQIVSMPNYLLYILIGVIGGTLTGLSFYSGFLLRSGKKAFQMDVI